MKYAVEQYIHDVNINADNYHFLVLLVRTQEACELIQGNSSSHSAKPTIVPIAKELLKITNKWISIQTLQIVIQQKFCGYENGKQY